MKWIERADCRPPNRSSSHGQVASIDGDMVRPVSTITGRSGRAARRGRRASAARCSGAPPRPSETSASRGGRCRARGSAAASSRSRGQQVAPQVPVDEAERQVARDAEPEDPGEGQVPAPRQRQVVVGGDGQPSRGTPGAGCGRRRSRAPSTPVVSSSTSPIRRKPRPCSLPIASQAGSAIGAVLAPVESGMGVEDHQPAHQHDDEGHHVDPVPDARGQAVPADEFPLSAARSGSAGRWSTSVMIPPFPASARRGDAAPDVAPPSVAGRALHGLAEHHLGMLGAGHGHRLSSSLRPPCCPRPPCLPPSAISHRPPSRRWYPSGPARPSR